MSLQCQQWKDAGTEKKPQASLVWDKMRAPGLRKKEH